MPDCHIAHKNWYILYFTPECNIAHENAYILYAVLPYCTWKCMYCICRIAILHVKMHVLYMPDCHVADTKCIEKQTHVCVGWHPPKPTVKNKFQNEFWTHIYSSLCTLENHDETLYFWNTSETPRPHVGYPRFLHFRMVRNTPPHLVAAAWRGGLVGWLAGLAGWIGWMAVGWLAGWLVGWLAGYVDWFRHPFGKGLDVVF